MNDLNSENTNLSAGKFIAEGEYTCVYLDPPVGCVPGTLNASDDYNPNDTSLVSRLAINSGKEFSNQTDVRNAMIRLDEKYPGLRFKDHFNIAVATCTPRMTNEDLQPKLCTVKDLKTTVNKPGDKPNVINFLTRRQGPDLADTDLVFKGMPLNEKRIKFRKAYFDLMNAAVALNSEEVIHYDMHSGNIGWTEDPWPLKTLVIFDWGLSILGYDNFLKNLIKDVKDLDDLKKYSQFKLQAEVITKIAKTTSKDKIRALIKEQQVKPKGEYFSSFEKLFFAWDTYSLIYKIYKDKYPGLEDFSEKKLGKSKKYLSGQFLIQLLNNVVLTVKIFRKKEIFIQELWNIIAAAFKETPVYKLGSNYVTTFSGSGLPLELEFEQASFVSVPKSKFTSKSPFFSSSKSRSSSRSSSTSRLTKKTSKSRTRYQVSITRKPSRSKKLKRGVVKVKKQKRTRKVKVICSKNKVLDKNSRRCRNPKKPGPKRKI
jgi:hypothetical protein